MEISYKLEHFEGPLDLLLHLIEKNKVNIYDIPIVEITEQYLDYVNHMEKEDLNVVSEFLVMAATLLDIKDGAGLHFYKNPTIPREVARYEPPVDLDKLLGDLTLARLQEIFHQVMRRQEDKIDRVRSNFGVIRKEPVSLEEKIGSVMAYARKHRSFSFRQMLESQADRIEIVVTFLAILELMKIGKINLVQEHIFDDMQIETLEAEGEEGELELEGLDDLIS